MNRREDRGDRRKGVMYELREDLHKTKMEAHGGKGGGGYTPDCQLGKRGTSKAGEKGREMKEGKGKHERKTIIPGRLTSQGFVCCQSGLYSVIDCEGLKNSKSL